MLTEVLKERDLQLEMKKRIEQMRQTDEDNVHQRYQESQNEFFKAEKEKIEQKAKYTSFRQYQKFFLFF